MRLSERELAELDEQVFEAVSDSRTPGLLDRVHGAVNRRRQEFGLAPVSKRLVAHSLARLETTSRVYWSASKSRWMAGRAKAVGAMSVDHDQTKESARC